MGWPPVKKFMRALLIRTLAARLQIPIVKNTKTALGPSWWFLVNSECFIAGL